MTGSFGVPFGTLTQEYQENCLFFLGLLLVSGLQSGLLPGSGAELLGRMLSIEEAQPGGMSWAATLGLWFSQR